MKISAKAFAKMFVRTRNGSETAVRLGAEPEEAKQIEADYLANTNVKKAIHDLDKGDEQTLCYVKTGLSRLAFGSVNEAVALVFAEEVSRDDVLKADLFNVSEIKRVRGGGVEVKVFDRIKALEKLYELENTLTESGRAEALIRALTSDGEEDAEC